MEHKGHAKLSFIVCLWTFVMSALALSPHRAYVNIAEGIRENTRICDVIKESGLDQTYEASVLRDFRFAISNGEYKDDFTVDRSHGYLRAATVIDRESLCPKRETCRIALDVAVVQPLEYFQVIQVFIDILDLNDNSPTFPQGVFRLQVSENTNPGVKFVLPAAQDPDSGENGIQEYRLDSDTSAFALKVNDERGGIVDLELILVESVDRERESQYRMHVVAIDGGTPPKTGSMQIHIKIVDANDNPPVFSNPVYNVTVPEDYQVATTLISVLAVDADKGPNGQVTYSLVDSPNCSFEGSNQNVFTRPESCIFCINSESGGVVLRTKLDYETESSHLLLVTATDHGANAVPSYAKVVVNVLDVNDVAPVITINAISSQTSPTEPGTNTGPGLNGDNYSVVEVTENLPSDSFVAYFSAEDTDEGVSGEVTCLINDNVTFRIESMFDHEYKITTRHTMDRERVDQYELVVTCKDHGDPSLSSHYTLSVKIADVNDNSPMFTQSVYTAELKENNAINVSILRVLAKDADIGKNAEVTYHVHSTYRALFSIDEFTGILRPKVVFDRETTEQVEAQILARDQGDEPRTGATIVRITILDDNDNPPMFSSNAYNFGTPENQPHGTDIGILSAVDPDTPPYAKHTFFLTSAYKSAYLPFVIDRYNGKITTTRTLDREKNPSYHLIATVTDSGNNSLSSKVNVTIYVTDQNDNPPTILFPNSAKDRVTVNEIPKIGSVVASISATDLDQGENARLQYAILHGNDWGMWEIEANRGDIMFMGNSSPLPTTEHLLVVVVKDSGQPQLSSTAQLTIIFNISNVDNDHLVGFQPPQPPRDDARTHGGIGPVLQFRIILVLAVVTTFIVLVLVAIIVVLRRRQIREKRKKKKPLPPHAKLHNEDHTYLFVNNNEGAAGSGFVKGVCSVVDPDIDIDRGIGRIEPGDGTSLLDMDLSSSGISMGSEAPTENEAVASGVAKDSTPLTIRNIAVEEADCPSPKTKSHRPKDAKHCNTGPPKPPTRTSKVNTAKNTTPETSPTPHEYLEVRPGGSTSISKPSTPIASIREPHCSFRTFHPNSSLSPTKTDSLESVGKTKNKNHVTWVVNDNCQKDNTTKVSSDANHKNYLPSAKWERNNRLRRKGETEIYEVTI